MCTLNDFIHFNLVKAAGSADIRMHDVSPTWSASRLKIAKDIKELAIQMPWQVISFPASSGFTRQNDNRLNWIPDKILSLWFFFLNHWIGAFLLAHTQTDSMLLNP